MEIHFFTRPATNWSVPANQTALGEFECDLASHYGEYIRLVGDGVEKREGARNLHSMEGLIYIVTVVQDDEGLDVVRRFKEQLEEAVGQPVVCSVLMGL